MNPLTIRLLSQQLIACQFTTPAQLVAHMGAMQAQDYRMVRWAVAMRMRHVSALDFKKAFDEGSIIRLHLFRGTWQLVAAEDYRWMLALCAPKAEATIRGWMKTNGVNIDEEEMSKVRQILISTCKHKKSVTKDEFSQALAEQGFTMDSHRLSYHLRLAELNGILCSGCLSPMRTTYSLVEDKVKCLHLPEYDEMLGMLARKYFQSHSPATFEDFVWWSGLGVESCRRGMDILGQDLQRIHWKGYDFFLYESCRTRGFRCGTTLLLPPYDEYLIGYKSRELALERKYVHCAHSNNGIFYPIVVHDGRVCGNWNPWGKDTNPNLFYPVDIDFSVVKQWEKFRRMCFGRS